MTQSKHTQGKWTIGEMVSRDIGNGEKELFYEISTDSTSICDVYLEGSLINYPRLEEGMANASLIACAPELLEALETMLWILDLDDLPKGENIHKAVQIAKKTVLKAKGEA